MSRHAAITGWGYYAPSKVLTNHDLETMVDTSDEWIRTRTGISERRIAEAHDTTTSMAMASARKALDKSGLSPIDLDLIICATTTPDGLLPSVACIVQEKLGAANAGAFDLNAACSGFVYSLIVASQFIESGTYDRILVVAGETLSRFINWKDRSTCILFGDGSGAVVLEATNQECGVLSAVLGSQGDINHLLAIEANETEEPQHITTLADGHQVIKMKGNEVFKFAVRSMVQAANEALSKANLSSSQVAKVIPHQANVRIIKATQESLGLTEDKIFVNVDRYGNTSAASVPIALCEFLESEQPAPGDNLLFVAFGGGLTWASAVVRWADIDAIIARREEEPYAF